MVLSASGAAAYAGQKQKAKEAKERTMIANVVNTFRIAKGSGGTSAVTKENIFQTIDATGSLVSYPIEYLTVYSDNQVVVRSGSGDVSVPTDKHFCVEGVKFRQMPAEDSPVVGRCLPAASALDSGAGAGTGTGTGAGTGTGTDTGAGAGTGTGTDTGTGAGAGTGTGTDTGTGAGAGTGTGTDTGTGAGAGTGTGTDTGTGAGAGTGTGTGTDTGAGAGTGTGTNSNGIFLYQPNKAIIVTDTLYFSGSVVVKTGISVPQGTADVHSNSSITITNNSLRVDGDVTAVQNNDVVSRCDPTKITGTCQAHVAPIPIPLPDARTFYNAAAAGHTLSGDWYDLCPDGTIRTPDPAGQQPCAGPVAASDTQTSGWVFTNGGTMNAAWTFDAKTNPNPHSTYYAYQTNVNVGGATKNAPAIHLSVVAEAKPNGNPGNLATCSASGGNISWTHDNIQNQYPGLIFLADGNLTSTSNTIISHGLIAAGNQLNWTTSSSTLTGAVIGAGRCSTAYSNSMQGVTVLYDPTGINIPMLPPQ